MGNASVSSSRRWAHLMGNQDVRVSQNGGKVGLTNLGNTCFMNAGLQCLCHLEPFAAYFLTGKYMEELNRGNPLGSGGVIAKGFATLQHALWQKNQKSYNPRATHALFRRKAPHLFEGYQQQDVQEFLAFCLDALHEDLNRVTSRPVLSDNQEEQDEALVKDKGDEFAAALAWFRYLQRAKSFLVDLFQGQLRNTLVCSRCGFKSTRFDPFLYLSVPVTRQMSTLDEAMEKYLEEEILIGSERWHCPTCKQRNEASKKIDLWKLPPILILHLKRFEFDAVAGRFTKIRTHLESSLTMDLSTFVSSPQREHSTYDVVAVANHLGAYGSGHYTATCRLLPENGHPEWFTFDDQRVHPVNGCDAITENAYVLFLVRRAGNGQNINRQTISLPEAWPHFVSASNTIISDVIRGNPIVPTPAPTPASAVSERSPSRVASPTPRHPAERCLAIFRKCEDDEWDCKVSSVT